MINASLQSLSPTAPPPHLLSTLVDFQDPRVLFLECMEFPGTVHGNRERGNVEGRGVVPVPPLSGYFGTHQRSKNAKLGCLLSRIRMSVKSKKKGYFYSLKFAKLRKRGVFLQLLNRANLKCGYKHICMIVMGSKRYLYHLN